MDRSDLQTKILSAGFPTDSYSLFGKPEGESLCIQYAAPKWIVFYSERGLQKNKKQFASEEAACDYFFRQLTSWFK